LLCMSAFAQGPADSTLATPATTADAAAPAPDPAPDPAPSPAPQYPLGSGSGDAWRVAISIYGWFPGLHGTVGALGHDAGIHVPFSDVFHTLKGIIPIAVEADKGRFVMPLDFFWVKLGDDKGLPFNDLGQTSVNIHLTESIFTPKLGYRLYDGEHLKIDALGGIRYWYVGQNLTLEPSNVGNSRSANWVDGLGGARFILPMGEKAAITVAGDAGAGGANLDYQALGLLNYNFTPKWGAAVGWRYLYVDYRPTNHQFVFNTAMTGLVAGVSYTFGGKPPVPPTASCSAQPTEVWSGDPVKLTATGANFNPKHTITYGWTGNGGKLSGANAETATVDTTGMTPGSYSAVATITDPKEKKNNSATCTANFSIKQPQPPVVSCSANPSTIAIGEPATITLTASDPQGWPMTYNWSSTGGQLSGSGTSATVTATNADAGNTITVTGTATDARANLSASCTASVNVPAVQKCAVIEDWGECTFEKNPKKPWRVDNDCKDTLDKLALRVQQMPNGKLNVVGYTNDKEVVSEQTLGSQRSVNVKFYLTTDGPTKVDASRIQPRQGGAKGQATHFYFVPEGNLCGGQLEEGTVVDETQVQGQSRTAAPAPKKHKAKKAAAPPSGN
jgi:outer membrane protein OmpA-like peptidoglycan-associated protein